MLDPDVHAVLDGPAIAHLATISPDGSPHSTPVYVGTHGGRVVLFTGPTTRKARNLRRDPRLALSIAPADNPLSPVVVRGRVVDWITGEAAWDVVDRLVAKYVDVPYPRDAERVVAVIEPDGADPSVDGSPGPVAALPAAGHVRAFDHVGITVADLPAATQFFIRLGLQTSGPPMVVEGEFLDTVIGIPGSRTEIVMLRAPAGSTTIELSSFSRPDHEPGSPAAMANTVGLRNVAFQVDDLDAVLADVAQDGYRLVGGIGQYEHSWRMAYLRGPEGIIVSLAEQIG